VTVAFDLSVSVDDRPGMLAVLGEATGRAGINLGGFCFAVVEGRGVGHVLVEDGEAAHRLLTDAGFQVGEPREVLVVDGEDRPGVLGGLARRFAAAGVNLEFAYLAAGGQLVLGPDDLARARSVL
jgi:hypothetical protein